ncbi:MAG: bifunctional phosphopantothenoylcysteine decarboxylase/phosphopantothenate--cysteine ligase CoaBC [bacterium]|nr:bifunctional phosphopantothenoylcysteine decarboxylase/phosphopantothenate--cysteine ligase CoaBC [bacterium]
MLKDKKILIGISGGIAAYKICYLVRMLVKQGAEVKIVMTPSAAKFVSPITLSTLSKNEVIINLFPANEDISKIEKVETKTWHVNLGLWADIFIIAPATANTIAKIVHGISDNFLLSAVLASRCPVIIAPTMDDDMYKNPVTQKNLNLLKEYGYKIISPSFGELASGIYGEGRMAEPEEISQYVSNFFSQKKDLTGKKILVTAGPTIEFLDSVRYLTNSSTGKMGFELARAANDRGASVTLITGPVSLDDIAGVQRINVKTADEMLRKVKDNIKKKDLLVMTAAVEDFKPVNTIDSKIKKENSDNFTFEFKKTVDILAYAGKNKIGFKLIGFALETENEIENARKKLINKNLDFIVVNNPKTEGAGFGTDTNVVTLLDKKTIEKLPMLSKYETGNKILDKYLQLK